MQPIKVCAAASPVLISGQRDCSIGLKPPARPAFEIASTHRHGPNRQTQPGQRHLLGCVSPSCADMLKPHLDVTLSSFPRCTPYSYIWGHLAPLLRPYSMGTVILQLRKEQSVVTGMVPSPPLGYDFTVLCYWYLFCVWVAPQSLDRRLRFNFVQGRGFEDTSQPDQTLEELQRRRVRSPVRWPMFAPLAGQNS